MLLCGSKYSSRDVLWCAPPPPAPPPRPPPLKTTESFRLLQPKINIVSQALNNIYKIATINHLVDVSSLRYYATYIFFRNSRGKLNSIRTPADEWQKALIRPGYGVRIARRGDFHGLFQVTNETKCFGKLVYKSMFSE